MIDYVEDVSISIIEVKKNRGLGSKFAGKFPATTKKIIETF